MPKNVLPMLRKLDALVVVPRPELYPIIMSLKPVVMLLPPIVSITPRNRLSEPVELLYPAA